MRSTAKDVGAARRVHGQVLAAGGVQLPGSADWTVTRTGVGVYVILFLRPFVANPSITVTLSGAAGYATLSISSGGVTVSLFTPAAAAQDANFTFSAEGRS